MNERVSIFSNLTAAPIFDTKPKQGKPVAEEMIEQVSNEHNFPSRQATRTPRSEKKKPRVRRTGRDQQFTAKMTTETKNRIYKLADERDVALGELLRLAVDALEREDSIKKIKPAST